MGRSPFPSYGIETVSGSNQLKRFAPLSLHQLFQGTEELEATLHDQIKAPTAFAQQIIAHILIFKNSDTEDHY